MVVKVGGALGGVGVVCGDEVGVVLADEEGVVLEVRVVLAERCCPVLRVEDEVTVCQKRQHFTQKNV